LQKKAVAWDADFAGFEQRYVPTEKESKRGGLVPLHRLFSESTPTSPEHALSPAVLPLAPTPEQDEQLAALGLGLELPPSMAASTTLGDEPSPAQAPAPLKSESDSALELLGKPSVPLTLENLAQLPVGSLTEPHESLDAPSPAETRSKTAPPSISGDHDDSETGSDTTVCADGPQRSARESIASSFGAMSGLDSDNGGPEVPRLHRKFRMATNVEALVKRFDPTKAPVSSQTMSPSITRSSIKTLRGEPSLRTGPPRPPFRRGKSDLPARPATPNKSSTTPDVFSDGERDGRRSIKRRPPKVSSATPSASGIPVRATVMVKSASDQAKPSISRYSTNTTIKPPSGATSTATSRATSPVKTRPPMHARGSTITLSGRRLHGGQDGDSGGSSSQTKGKPRVSGVAPGSRISFIEANQRPSMRRKVSAGPSVSASGSIVKNKIRHFENQAQQQRKAMLRMRARPLAASKPVLDVYHSSQDLFKDDSDEEQGRSEDENEADGEYDMVRLPSDVVLIRTSDISQDEDNERTVKGRPIIKPLPARAPSPILPLPSMHDSAVLTTQALLFPPTDAIAESAASSSLVSLPASPLVGYASDAAVGARYVSESEMSAGGSERHSIMRTLSAMWTWRGAEFTPLDYPLCVSNAHRMSVPSNRRTNA
jgi:1-phosphatidylinositol-3-phosphate 5-kinase